MVKPDWMQQIQTRNDIQKPMELYSASGAGGNSSQGVDGGMKESLSVDMINSWAAQ